MNKRIIVIIALGAVVLFGFIARAVPRGQSSLLPKELQKNQNPYVAAEGRVVAYPGADIRVGAEQGGRLVRVPIEEGQEVEKGQLLVEIDSEELHAALLESRARVTEAQAEVRLAEINQERKRKLVEQGILAPHDFDPATRDLETTRARSATAKAVVSRYETQISKTRIVAPISGTVTSRRVNPGEMVKIGDTIVTLANLKKLRIEGEADEADAGALHIGAPVIITSDAYPTATWKGAIEEVADSVTLRHLKPQDPGRPTDTRILAVKVAFSESTPLRLGTTVELKIQPATRGLGTIEKLFE